MDYIANTLSNLWHQTAFTTMTPGNYAMICVAFLFLYLAIRWDFEPLLLIPISFGMLLVNIYPDIMLSIEDSSNGVGGLLYYFYVNLTDPLTLKLKGKTYDNLYYYSCSFSY